MTDDYYGDDAATFGDRLAAAREALGFTQSQLASRAGVRLATLQNWESDRSEPRANKLQMIAGLLNVSIIWLLTGVGEGGVQPEPAGDAARRSTLAELREIRVAQQALLDRISRLEKKLREAGEG
ncbi:MAG: helix-turn-helix transcriptional regulator [Pseudomonadota bacterium]|nr:helix-turn-helix transcriptional regulator [Pseudomonadota bacterium]